eukprot:m.142491 g.142491  ORF g.142491 m.142491 type:complete len:363 (-) comp15995_c0_seq3:2286-3374(-)
MGMQVTYGWTLLRLLLFGCFGLHHFHLGRDFQAFLWTISGGGFGIGLLYDLFRLQRYVEEANCSDRAQAERNKLIQWRSEKGFLRAIQRKLYDWFSSRAFGQVVFGTYLRQCAFWTLPRDPKFGIPLAYSGLFGGLASAWTVVELGRQGYQDGNAKAAFALAAVAEAYMGWVVGLEDGLGSIAAGIIVTCVALWAFRSGLRYNPIPTSPPPRSLCKRGFKHILLIGLFVTCAFSGFIFHVPLEINHEHATIADHFLEYTKSSEWLQLKAQFGVWYTSCLNDPERCWEDLSRALMTPEDRAQSALATLGLHAGATMQEIKTAYRQSARLLHPDKCNTKECADQFMALQDAYNYLLKSKKDETI